MKTSSKTLSKNSIKTSIKTSDKNLIKTSSKISGQKFDQNFGAKLQEKIL